MVSAVIKIEQFAPPDGFSTIREAPLSITSRGEVRDDPFDQSSVLLFSHIPHISQPSAKGGGWSTENEDLWLDSPTKQPFLLYRLRGAFGRDRRELFNTGFGTLAQGADGSRWGHLDNSAGVLMYNRVFSSSSSGSIRQFKIQGTTSVRDFGTSLSTVKSVSHIPGISGDVTLEMFPFVVTMFPLPFSQRNPLNSDVFIRISNFAFPIVSGTINLYLNDEPALPLQITEFFGGLGGFDVSWDNNRLFDYDETVNVRLEFFDSDVPPNKYIIRYPFYTVTDLAPPRITNLVPDHEAVDVPIQSSIQFDIVDFEQGVDISTLKLFVNNVRIIDGIHGTIEWVELEDGGYTVKYSPAETWLYGDLIPVAIFVKDASAAHNERFFTYSFTTIGSLVPRLINLEPRACAVGVPVQTTVQADVIDGGHGFDPESLLFTVEEIERGNTILIIPIVHRDD